MCIIYHGLEWYNLRELYERKLTTTARGILHLFHSVALVTVIDVGADFVTINEHIHGVYRGVNTTLYYGRRPL